LISFTAIRCGRNTQIQTNIICGAAKEVPRLACSISATAAEASSLEAMGTFFFEQPCLRG
jgi:hypothetical protein